MMKPHVRVLCDSLVANDPTFTEVNIFLKEEGVDEASLIGYHPYDDDDLDLVFDAMKSNHTIEKVSFESGVLSAHAALSLASAVLVHSKMKYLSFDSVRIESFCAIALAFRQNENLTGLHFFDCCMTPRLMEHLRSLLSANALEALSVDNCQGEENEQLDLSGALRSNQSLKELVLRDDSNETISPDTIQDIPLLLRANQDFQVLGIHGIHSDMVSQVAKAMEGHKSLNKLAVQCRHLEANAVELIRRALQNTPALRILDLSSCYIGAAGMSQLSYWLCCENRALSNLDLCYNDLGDDGACILSRVIETDQKLKSLSLSLNRIGNSGACALAGALKQNNTIEKLDLRYNEVSSEGATAIARALHYNSSLNDIGLNGNPIGDNGTIDLAEMLSINTTIETIAFGHMGIVGMKVLVANLPHMRGLKTIGLGDLAESSFTSEVANDLVNAIEQNMTLEHIYLYGTNAEISRIRPSMNHFLALNRGGRKILKSPSVPHSLWPRILGRWSNDTDAIFYFLHQKPDVIFGKSCSTRKPKQEDGDASSIPRFCSKFKWGSQDCVVS